MCKNKKVDWWVGAGQRGVGASEMKKQRNERREQ